jgi:hypothetical protein
LITYNRGAKISQRESVIYAPTGENAVFYGVSDGFVNPVSLSGLQKPHPLPITRRAMRLSGIRPAQGPLTSSRPGAGTNLKSTDGGKQRTLPAKACRNHLQSVATSGSRARQVIALAADGFSNRRKHAPEP